MTDLEVLSNKVLELEKRYQSTKKILILGCIAIAALGIMGQGRGLPGDVLPDGRLKVEGQSRLNSAVEGEVRAHHFVLVDQSGKERASLVADGAGSVFLVMFDNNGRTRTNLSVGNDGPGLVFYDPSGQARAAFGSTGLVSSHVSENGVVERTPASSIVLFDRSGKLLWRTP